MKYPIGYWNKEKCQELALQCETRTSFHKKYPTGYNTSNKNGWLNEICSHMIVTKKPKGYWTKEKCHQEALKYKTKTEFRKYCCGAYRSSLYNNWLDVFSHMNPLHKPKGYWTKEKCHQEALKYKTRTEFKNNTSSAYSIAYNNGWLDEICSQMEIIGNRYTRCIYVYEFKDNHAYVGLTYNLRKRNNSHLRKGCSPVYQHIENGCKEYNLVQLTDYIPVKDAQKLEKKYLNKYRKEEWDILNKATPGSIGGTYYIWTYESVKEEALKYKSRVEFIKNASGAHDYAYTRNIMDDVCSHMEYIQKPAGYWTKEKCQKIALKYNKRSTFKNEGTNAYKAAIRKGWLDDICSHMIVYFNANKTKNKYWTPQEESFLISNIDKGVDFCSQQLNRSETSVTGKWNRLKTI